MGPSPERADSTLLPRVGTRTHIIHVVHTLIYVFYFPVTATPGDHCLVALQVLLHGPAHPLPLPELRLR